MGDKSTCIIGTLKNEIQSHAAAIVRLTKLIETLKEQEANKNLDMPVAIDWFIKTQCVEDAEEWEDSNRLYDEFTVFKTAERIKTKILKRTFFIELESLGFYRNPGRVLFEGEPEHSIRGIYLKRRQAEVEAAKASRAEGMQKAKDYLEERQEAELEEENRAFEALLNSINNSGNADAGTSEENTEGRGIFDFES